MNNLTKKIKSVIVPVLLISLCSLLAYLVFNIFLFMIITLLLTIALPIVFAFVNNKNGLTTSKLSFYEVIMCIVFSVIITGFNNIIVESDKFKKLMIPYLNNDTVSIQKINIVTYIIAIIIFIGIYYITVKKFNKEGQK